MGSLAPFEVTLPFGRCRCGTSLRWGEPQVEPFDPRLHDSFARVSYGSLTAAQRLQRLSPASHERARHAPLKGSHRCCSYNGGASVAYAQTAAERANPDWGICTIQLPDRFDTLLETFGERCTHIRRNLRWLYLPIQTESGEYMAVTV